MYTSEGAASHLAQYIDLYNQAVQTELDDPTEQNEQALAGLAAKIAQELAQFRHGGSWMLNDSRDNMFATTMTMQISR